MKAKLLFFILFLSSVNIIAQIKPFKKGDFRIDLNKTSTF